MTDTPRSVMEEAFNGEITRLRERVAELEKALLKIKQKAGIHTVFATQVSAGESDPGFAGIWAVADNALSAAKEPKPDTPTGQEDGT